MPTTTTVQSIKPHVPPWWKKEATRKHWTCSKKGEDGFGGGAKVLHIN